MANEMFGEITLSVDFGETTPTTVAQIVDDFKIGEESVDNVEIKIHGTNRKVRNIPGWEKWEPYECSCIYDATQSALLRSLKGISATWTITLEDTSAYAVVGYISSFGLETPLGDVVKNTIKIMPEGEPTFTPAT